RASEAGDGLPRPALSVDHRQRDQGVAPCPVQVECHLMGCLAGALPIDRLVIVYHFGHAASPVKSIGFSVTKAVSTFFARNVPQAGTLRSESAKREERRSRYLIDR